MTPIDILTAQLASGDCVPQLACVMGREEEEQRGYGILPQNIKQLFVKSRKQGNINVDIVNAIGMELTSEWKTIS